MFLHLLRVSVLASIVPLDALDGLPIGTLTPAGLLAAVIGLIALGKLVPRSTMQDVIKDRDEWREAHRISEASRAEQARTIDNMGRTLETVEAILRAALPNSQQFPVPSKTDPPHPDGGAST